MPTTLTPDRTADRRLDQPLPAGVTRHGLSPAADARGSFTEIFRETWPLGIRPLQWGLLQSRAGVLRGVHVHPRHDEFILVAVGAMLLGLKDLRRDSPSFGLAALLNLSGERPELVTLPHGVAHGFYHATDTSLLLATSQYYDPTDDLGCQWADPALGIPWPVRNPELSERDRKAPPFAELMAELDRRR
jgi:dTDP-4-dehydrorhamnose 3,5-epimerase